jgi:hypothetical protein
MYLHWGLIRRLDTREKVAASSLQSACGTHSRTDIPTYPTTCCSVTALVLNVLVAQSMGLLLGAAVMNPKTAQTIASVLMLAFMLVGGYYVRVSGNCIHCVPGEGGGQRAVVGGCWPRSYSWSEQKPGGGGNKSSAVSPQGCVW